MAGFYNDVPAQRFALDIDGTVFKTLDSAKTTLTDAQTASTLISDTDSDFYQVTTEAEAGRYFVVIFPELRDLIGYFIVLSGTGLTPFDLDWSSDTTDGMDGTWTNATTSWTYSTSISPTYRTQINSQPLPGIKALRFGCKSINTGNFTNDVFNIQLMHLYGSITGGQNPDRLRFWHASLDQEAGPAYFDFGDNPVGTNKVIQFRVRNNSATKTANSIDLAKASASYADVATGLSFSNDGSTYSATLNIGDLAPGATSSIIYLKRTFDPSETTSVPKEGRITGTASTWS
jgi:hypothetical protein